jgi:hypothetical protein
MTEQEWIERLRHESSMLDEEVRGLRRFAEHQKSAPNEQSKTLRLAESMEAWAEQIRQQVKRLEESSPSPSIR